MSRRSFGVFLLAFTLAACSSDDPVIEPIVEPEVRTTGSIEIPATWVLDLETGTLDSGAAGDVWNHSIGDGDSELEGRNGATMALMGSTEPDYAACLDATYGSDGTQLHGLTPPQHFCVTTGEGRTAIVTLTVGPTSITNNVEVDFTTWELPS